MCGCTRRGVFHDFFFFSWLCTYCSFGLRFRVQTHGWGAHEGVVDTSAACPPCGAGRRQCGACTRAYPTRGGPPSNAPDHRGVVSSPPSGRRYPTAGTRATAWAPVLGGRWLAGAAAAASGAAPRVPSHGADKRAPSCSSLPPASLPRTRPAGDATARRRRDGGRSGVRTWDEARDTPLKIQMCTCMSVNRHVRDT